MCRVEMAEKGKVNIFEAAGRTALPLISPPPPPLDSVYFYFYFFFLAAHHYSLGSAWRLSTRRRITRLLNNVHVSSTVNTGVPLIFVVGTRERPPRDGDGEPFPEQIFRRFPSPLAAPSAVFDARAGPEIFSRAGQ